MIETYHHSLGRVALVWVNKVGDGIALKPQHPLDDGLARVLRRQEEYHVPDGDGAPSDGDPIYGDDVAGEVHRGEHARSYHLQNDVEDSIHRLQNCVEDEQEREKERGKGAHQWKANDVGVNDVGEAESLEDEEGAIDGLGRDVPPGYQTKTPGGAGKPGGGAAPHRHYALPWWAETWWRLTLYAVTSSFARALHVTDRGYMKN